MSENSAIEWTDHTFNPWEGCQKVGPGCDHCYAETRNARFAGGTAINWGPGAPRRRTSASNWNKPLAWNKAHAEFFAKHGRRQRVFCASLADVFDNAVDRQWRQDLFDVILATPNLDWLLLTKRIGNAAAMLQDVAEQRGTLMDANDRYRPLPNVWIGATIINQEEADRDIPKLLAVPAARRFLSMEPLLGAVDLGRWLWTCCGKFGVGAEYMGQQEQVCCGSPEPRDVLDWVIVGGESGPGARPMHPDWARSLRNQCSDSGVPFLFKQWGEYGPAALDAVEGQPEPWRIYPDGRRCWSVGEISASRESWLPEIMVKVGKKLAGRQLDDMQHDGYPEAL